MNGLLPIVVALVSIIANTELVQAFNASLTKIVNVVDTPTIGGVGAIPTIARNTELKAASHDDVGEQRNPYQSRKEFFSSLGGGAVGIAALTAFGAMNSSPAQAMDQYNDMTPTEVWTTGKPTTAKGKPNERTINARGTKENLFPNARTQLNSNFAPIKRQNLERKSPVTRLDLNGPNFEGYKKTYPGLYKLSLKSN